LKIFLDTSSLIKLYYKEEGTSSLDKIFAEYSISEIFISEITKVEFFSAIYKKLRTKHLHQQNVNDILSAFISDEHNYSIVLMSSEIIDVSQSLIKKYGIAGLRSLDAIQLASVCNIKGQIELAITNDKLLNDFLISENVKVPNFT
jgi:predicted nucleic acid-binding protein